MTDFHVIRSPSEMKDDIENQAAERWTGCLMLAEERHLINELERIEANSAKLLAALEGLVARFDVFTSDDRNGWGNQHDAYYDLAKHAQTEWAVARAAIATAKVTP